MRNLRLINEAENLRRLSFQTLKSILTECDSRNNNPELTDSEYIKMHDEVYKDASNLYDIIERQEYTKYTELANDISKIIRKYSAKITTIEQWKTEDIYEIALYNGNRQFLVINYAKYKNAIVYNFNNHQ